ncbi:MAG: DUF1572 family protein [Flavobacteriales bacterium]|nr:DUF1572 family protein [Flavobacteriales bacterium]
MTHEKILLINDVKRRVCDEGIERILNCLDLLSDEQIWFRSNENSNSIGNLILHLNGNVRQWIFSGLLDEKDTRDRPMEFAQRETIFKEKLKEKLLYLRDSLSDKLVLLKDVDLGKKRTIQGLEENGVSVLVHVAEHFSYHTGQIALLTKHMLNQDLGFYDQTHLNDLNS